MVNIDLIYRWLDNIFSKQIPSDVEAVYINLVESSDTVEVEFYRIGPFDRGNEDWACDFIYQTESITIPLDKGEHVPSGWEKLLRDISLIISDYVSSKSAAHRLSSVSRVSVGFGDSEIILFKDEI